MRDLVITLANAFHHDFPVVSLSFEKDFALIATLPFALKEQFKKLEGAWWHPKLKQWSALDNEENCEQLKALLQASKTTEIYTCTRHGTFKRHKRIIKRSYVPQNKINLQLC